MLNRGVNFVQLSHKKANKYSTREMHRDKTGKLVHGSHLLELVWPLWVSLGTPIYLALSTVVEITFTGITYLEKSGYDLPFSAG